MAITTAMCTSFKQELLEALHDFNASGGNTFKIGLFKDTVLVGIIGLYDLLLIVQAANTDQKWVAPQTHSTGFFFAAAVFWIFCFGMSRYSMFMERQLDTGHKN